MKEYYCRRCHQIKEEKEFWKVYKENLVDKISNGTKQLVKGRGNIQIYCKECCRGWFKDNKWRERAYSLKYRMAQRERQKDERINIL